MARFDQGWVKLYRQHSEVDFGNDGHISWIYYKLMAWANLRETKVKHGKDQISIPRGGVLTSYTELSDATKFERRIVRRCIEWLVKHKYVSVCNIWNATIVTIAGYDFYQTNLSTTQPCESSEIENGGDHTVQQPVQQPASNLFSNVPHIEELRIKNTKIKEGEGDARAREETPPLNSFPLEENQEGGSDIAIADISPEGRDRDRSEEEVASAYWLGVIKKNASESNLELSEIINIFELSVKVIWDSNLFFGANYTTFTECLLWVFDKGSQFIKDQFLNPRHLIKAKGHEYILEAYGKWMAHEKKKKIRRVW